MFTKLRDLDRAVNSAVKIDAFFDSLHAYDWFPTTTAQPTPFKVLDPSVYTLTSLNAYDHALKTGPLFHHQMISF